MAGKVLRVIVDQRERNQELIELLEASGMEVSFDTLPVGDYAISERVCIERKTISDFESSMMSGRLFEQIARLREAYAFPILILEGEYEEFRLKSKVINGAIASLYIDYGINVMHSHGEKNTAEMISSLAKHESQGRPSEPSAKGGFKSLTQRDFQEHVVGNLPGVGPKLAKALLKRFGSVRGIADAEIEELTEVEKIGDKKAELIHKTINAVYEGED
ncbi:MAG TPA: ERCC4 domain-containing protein [Candidatus Acidoferrales bacterium]|nr:ERCC4 domain-containing protein [Candidatus Acidoferrales bacterium]